MSRWERIWPYTLVFVLIHMSSGASVIALSDAALAAVAVLTVGIAYMKQVRIDKHFYTFTYIYICLSFFYMMQFGWLNFTATARIYLKILYVYLTIKLLRGAFLVFCEDIIAKLAMLSLPLFVVQYVAPDLMMSINNLSEFVIPQVPKGQGVDYSNSILFTVNPWGLERNSGFMWEPGGFAAMLSVAAFLNMIIYRFKLNWKLGAMLIALITTASTTGYLLFVLLGVFWVMNQKAKSVIITLPFFLIVGGYLMTMPEVTEKVNDRVENWDKTVNNQEDYADDREGISIGRIASFVLDWEDLMEYPVIGYGLQQSERTTGRYITLVRANGFSDHMAKFGLLGIAFLLYGLTVSFIRFSRTQGGGHGLWMGTIIVCTLAFSNPVLVMPFFLGLQFYFIAHQRKLLTNQTHAKSSYRNTNLQQESASR